MDDNIGKIIGEIRSIDESASVYLFGSRARGDHHENSDYDILVVSSNTNTDLANPVRLSRVAVKHYIRADMFFVSRLDFEDDSSEDTIVGIVKKEGIKLS